MRSVRAVNSWCNRSGRLRLVSVARTPNSRTDSSSPCCRTRPYPVLRSPGSTPSTARGPSSEPRASGLEPRDVSAAGGGIGRQDRIREVGVGVDALHVVQLLQLVQELEGGESVLLAQGDGTLGHHGQLAGGYGHSGLFEGAAHRLQVLGLGIDLQRAVLQLEVVGAGVDGLEGHVFGPR